MLLKLLVERAKFSIDAAAARGNLGVSDDLHGPDSAQLPGHDLHVAGQRSVGEVRMEKGRVIVPPLEAEERPASVKRLEETVTSRLPMIDLPDLLIEVDQWTDFAKALRHLSGQEPRRSDLLPTLYAALLSQGCNFGFARMAQMADISADRLAWCTAWHLREETLERPRQRWSTFTMGCRSRSTGAAGRCHRPMDNTSRWPARFVMPPPSRATFVIKG